MNRNLLKIAGTAAVLSITSQAAYAHVGIGQASGFTHGFWHPLGGLDHVLAMVMVGLLAAQLGGRAVWLVPAAFLSVMMVGGALGMTGFAVPLVELGIGLSVVILGAAVALGIRIAVVLAMALVGFFAIFHGYAHGAEMPETGAGFAYVAGFVLATAMLHAAGLGFGSVLSRKINNTGASLVRVAGGVTAVAGVAIVAGLF